MRALTFTPDRNDLLKLSFIVLALFAITLMFLIGPKTQCHGPKVPAAILMHGAAP